MRTSLWLHYEPMQQSRLDCGAAYIVYTCKGKGKGTGLTSSTNSMFCRLYTLPPDHQAFSFHLHSLAVLHCSYWALIRTIILTRSCTALTGTIATRLRGLYFYYLLYYSTTGTVSIHPPAKSLPRLYRSPSCMSYSQYWLTEHNSNAGSHRGEPTTK